MSAAILNRIRRIEATNGHTAHAHELQWRNIHAKAEQWRRKLGFEPRPFICPIEPPPQNADEWAAIAQAARRRLGI